MAEEQMAENETSEEGRYSDEDYKKAKGYLAQVLAREQKFKETWWKRAEQSEKLYSQPSGTEGEKYKSVYNILYSNTEVLAPSLYSATAKPDIRTRFKDAKLKPIPEVIERFLTLYTDSAAVGQESFDDAVKDAVLSSLTAAMGCLRLRLYEDQEFPLQTESVGYRNFIWGYAKKWARVPWVAFKHELSKEEFKKQFKIEDEDFSTGFKSVTEVEGSEKRADCVVYEFWHKASQTVWFVSEDWTECLLQRTDDPLQLRGFFPTPGLLMLTLKPGELEPIPLYWYYQNQAEELNRVTYRLNKVLSAIRVRGAYNSLLSDDLQKILADTETENALVPAGESLALTQGGGFEKNIWLLPLDKLVATAESLYRAREAIKQVIYELTGISDIIRGSNVASETATATQTKDKWGTLRLRKMQTVVANYIRDLFRLAVDAGSTQLPAETWKRLVQLPIPLEQEKALAQQQLQFMQQQAQERQMMAQQLPPEAAGQIPPPKPPPPELLAQAQSPSMEEILQQIASDVGRTFTINIQTSSTIDLDTAQDKTEVSEFMNALGQMLAGLQPLMAFGPPGVETVKALLVAVCQRFKFGLPVVDIIETIKPPPPPQPPPPDPAKMAEVEVKKVEGQMRMQEMQAKQQLMQAETANKLQLMQAELEMQKQELALKAQELQMKERELLRKEQIAVAQHQRDLLTPKPAPATVPARKSQNAAVRR